MTNEYRNNPTKGKRNNRTKIAKHPTFHVGDMLAHYEEIVESKGYMLFTANSTLKSNQELVMGAGIAKQVAQMFPLMPAIAGRVVRDRCNDKGVYGVIMDTGRKPMMPIGLFQTKTDWKKNSTLELVEHSLSVLSAYAHKTRTYDFHVNFPAIGKGGLRREDVVPLLMDILPRNVHIWELGS